MGIVDSLTRVFRSKSFVETQEGILDSSWPINYWQNNQRPIRASMNSVSEACIDTIAQTVAQCPVYHWADQPDGGQKEIVNSPAARLMHRPNAYQTRSDLWLNAIHSLYKEGNAYIYIGERNNKNEPTSMHLLNPFTTRGFRNEETGEIFYALSPTGWVRESLNLDEMSYAPARDMIHIRLHTPHDPLRGVSPISAAAASISANNSIVSAQAAFFTNMSRPSGVLSTEEKLNRDQMTMLREAWEQQSTNINSGRIPILSSGLKWYPLAITSQDSQLIEALKFTVEDISRVFRVPLPLINAMSGQTFNNAESMLNWWLSSGLGFLLDHIELALNHAFGLPYNEHLNFDNDVLLRSDLQTRINALGEAVMKSVYSPNEARRRLGMPAVEHGDEPRAQQQVVPLSYYKEKLDLDRRKVELQEAKQEASEEQSEDDAESETDEGEEVPEGEEDKEESVKSMADFLRANLEKKIAKG